MLRVAQRQGGLQTLVHLRDSSCEVLHKLLPQHRAQPQALVRLTQNRFGTEIQLQLRELNTAPSGAWLLAYSSRAPPGGGITGDRSSCHTTPKCLNLNTEQPLCEVK